MRVGISAYLLHAGEDYRSAGVSTYTYQLIRHLPAERRYGEYVAFVGPDAPQLDGLTVSRTPIPTENPLVRIGWEQFALPFQAASRHIDLIHGTVNVIPWLAGVRRVVTIHDLSFVVHPERFRPARRLYLQGAVRTSVRRADHIIAVSKQTRDDLIRLWRVAPCRISVIYSGVGSQFRPIDPGRITAFRSEVTDDRRYILHVGTLEPRKNIETLIRAYASLGRPRSHALILVGARGWYFDTIFRLIDDLGLQDDVKAVGYIGPADLPLWYNSADLFVYPSAYEGFGLPVLEAMACGVPTIISRAGALREVAGDAALSVPATPDALSEAIVSILGNPDMPATMREAGLRRASGFTWARTANQTAALYERVVHGE